MNPVITELERAAMTVITWAEVADSVVQSRQSAAVRAQARKLLTEIATLREMESK